jgi:hypothetical protein
MEYVLGQGQIIRKIGIDTNTATIIVPPFRCKSLTIDFFCELADSLSEKNTIYQMDYSYMKPGNSHKYSECLPDKELSELKELYTEVSKSHSKVNLVSMCLGAAFSIYLSDQNNIHKMVLLSVVDLENFKDFLEERYKKALPVTILPPELNETLIIAKDRAEWYNNKKTSDIIGNITAKTLFISYDQDPFVYEQNRIDINNEILQNKNCSLYTLKGINHRPGENTKKIIELTKHFLFDDID